MYHILQAREKRMAKRKIQRQKTTAKGDFDKSPHAQNPKSLQTADYHTSPPVIGGDIASPFTSQKKIQQNRKQVRINIEVKGDSPSFQNSKGNGN